MIDGNAHFAAGRLTSFDPDLALLRQTTVAKQEPFAAVLSCADCRVPVELVFDQSIGQVFVARVAGNICTPEIIASLEYGAAELGTRAIVVLGHSGCGAVKATIAAKQVPGQISALYAAIRPAVERAGPDLDAAIKANAQIQADLLRTASPVIAGLVAGGKLKVAAGSYRFGQRSCIVAGLKERPGLARPSHELTAQPPLADKPSPVKMLDVKVSDDGGTARRSTMTPADRPFWPALDEHPKERQARVMRRLAVP